MCCDVALFPMSTSMISSAFGPILCSHNLSSTVLKSSRKIVSVKHLNTNANFQKGLRPPMFTTVVTDKTSTITKATLRLMLRSKTPKRGDALISSMKEKL